MTLLSFQNVLYWEGGSLGWNSVTWVSNPRFVTSLLYDLG